MCKKFKVPGAFQEQNIINVRAEHYSTFFNVYRMMCSAINQSFPAAYQLMFTYLKLTIEATEKCV